VTFIVRLGLYDGRRALAAGFAFEAGGN
jgi:hypothetical protein